MSKAFKGISLIFLLTCCIRTSAQYTISGKLNNYDKLWINELSLSAITSLSQIYFASSDIVINKDSLDKQGNFSMSGNSLPDESRIYRLDLTNQKNKIMLQSSSQSSNYIFLILNNHSSVKINCPDFSKSSYNYTVEGSPENSELQKFVQMKGGLQELFNNPSSENGTGKEYAVNKFNTSIKNFCDSCKYPLVSIIAINEIIDFDKDYLANTAFYKQFLDKIKAQIPNSIYVKDLEKKLYLLDYQNKPASSQNSNALNALVYIEGIIILLLLGIVLFLANKVRRAKAYQPKTEPNRSELFETLTRREKEILALLIADIQNKEIAAKLNLEVSTIKSHIGKIYQKLAISNRNEVRAYEPFLKSNNVKVD